MQTIHHNNIHDVLNQYVVGDPMPLVFDPIRSHGHFLHDAVSGKEYLDFFCFFAARALAFDNPMLRTQDFLDRLLAAALHKPSNCDMYSEAYARFVDVFVHKALGGHFSHVFFIEGGSPAVENAVKSAMDWKHRKNIAAGRGEKGSQIIHFKQAFHGRTGYSLSLTDSYDVRKTQYYAKFGWPRITNPKRVFPETPESLEALKIREEEALREMDAAFDTHGHDVAGVIIEPIQGEGGDNYFRTEFLKALRVWCDEHEVLLMFDEVQTGLGATGRYWDYENHGVRPDVLVFGKKTQVCGIAATRRLDEVDSVFHIKSRISSTFSGGLVDMVRCEQIVHSIEEQKLLQNASMMGAYALDMLHNLSCQFKEMTAVRGRGLWLAFDMPDTACRNALVEKCFQRQLIILPCGLRSIRLRPALDIDKTSIDMCAERLAAALHEGKPGAGV